MLAISFAKTSISTAQQSLSHYYIKMNGKHKGSTPYKYEVGKILYDSEFNVKFDKWKTVDLNEFKDNILDSMNVQGDDYDLNVYIHGVWANHNPIWKKSVKNLTADVFDKMERRQVIISIIWDSSFRYDKSVVIAYAKGKELGPVFKSLLEEQNARSVNVIAHSMGNRVFQGMVEEQLPADTIRISKYISMGADLESNIFDQDQPLSSLPTLCNEIVIYVHNNDRTLKVSKLLNSNRRLGLHGISDSLYQYNCFKTIDVTLITDNESITSKITNHKYYYTSPIVREDLFNELDAGKSSLRHELDHENSFVLKASSEYHPNFKLRHVV